MKKLIVFVAFFAFCAAIPPLMMAHTPDVKSSESIGDLITGSVYLTIAGKFGGEITPFELAEFTSIDVQGCHAGTKIFQYELVITRGKKSASYKGKSDNLTQEMFESLRELSKGDEFTFKNVKARSKDKKEIEVWAKKFFVT